MPLRLEAASVGAAHSGGDGGCDRRGFPSLQFGEIAAVLGTFFDRPGCPRRMPRTHPQFERCLLDPEATEAMGDAFDRACCLLRTWVSIATSPRLGDNPAGRQRREQYRNLINIAVVGMPRARARSAARLRPLRQRPPFLVCCPYPQGWASMASVDSEQLPG